MSYSPKAKIEDGETVFAYFVVLRDSSEKNFKTNKKQKRGKESRAIERKN